MKFVLEEMSYYLPREISQERVPAYDSVLSGIGNVLLTILKWMLKNHTWNTQIDIGGSKNLSASAFQSGIKIVPGICRSWWNTMKSVIQLMQFGFNNCFKNLKIY